MQFLKSCWLEYAERLAGCEFLDNGLVVFMELDSDEVYKRSGARHTLLDLGDE
jgi:hypothetical protein